MGLEGRSNRSDGLAILVDVEKMGAVPVVMRIPNVSGNVDDVSAGLRSWMGVI